MQIDVTEKDIKCINICCAFLRVLLTQWIQEIIEQVTALNPPLLNNILVVTMMTNLLSLGKPVFIVGRL